MRLFNGRWRGWWRPGLGRTHLQALWHCFTHADVYVQTGLSPHHHALPVSLESVWREERLTTICWSQFSRLSLSPGWQIEHIWLYKVPYRSQNSGTMQRFSGKHHREDCGSFPHPVLQSYVHRWCQINIWLETEKNEVINHFTSHKKTLIRLQTRLRQEWLIAR